jgi:uncharacterized HAD superfamily protein
MDYCTYNDLDIIIRKNFSKFTSWNPELVVGIQRSGMIPAYMVSMALNVQCCTITDLIENREIKVLSSRDLKSSVVFPWEAKKILIIDDSVNEGLKYCELLSQIPRDVREKCINAAIFVSRKSNKFLDLYLDILPVHIFEWHIFHRKFEVENSGFDLDGVLCDNPTIAEESNEDNYVSFIKSAKPKYIPTYEIKAIVTSRLEKYRLETEQWLRANNVKYKKLIMLNLSSNEERASIPNCSALYKAKVYIEGDFYLFYESNEVEARVIAMETGKSVYCIDSNKIIEEHRLKGSLLFSAAKRRDTTLYYARMLLGHNRKLYNFCKYIYLFFRKRVYR